MKNKQIIYLVLVVTLIGFFSCKKDETKVVISSNPVPPVFLTPASGADIIFNSLQGQDTMMFTWKTADYGFKASVQYRVQLDTVTTFSFKPAKLLNVTFSDTLLVQNSVLNTFLVKGFKLKANIKYTFYARVRAMTDAGTDTIYSDPVMWYFTTY
jgi:hypothetical protein